MRVEGISLDFIDCKSMIFHNCLSQNTILTNYKQLRNLQIIYNSSNTNLSHSIHSSCFISPQYYSSSICSMENTIKIFCMLLKPFTILLSKHMYIQYCTKYLKILLGHPFLNLTPFKNIYKTIKTDLSKYNILLNYSKLQLNRIPIRLVFDRALLIFKLNLYSKMKRRMRLKLKYCNFIELKLLYITK